MLNFGEEWILSEARLKFRTFALLNMQSPRHWNDRRLVDRVSNVMAHAQKTDFVFRRNGWVHLKRQGRQFIWLLAAEVCASAVVILDTPCSELVWRVLATHSIRQFPPSIPLPCVTVWHHVSTGLYTLKPVYEQEDVTVLWNAAIRTDRQVKAKSQI